MATKRVAVNKQRMTNHYVNRSPAGNALVMQGRVIKMAAAFAALEAAWPAVWGKRDGDSKTTEADS